ncbi:MAG: PBECR2 nuclease fold domain-containing protein [Bacteroides sp.]
MNDEIMEIGLLDKKIYKCITNKIDTDRVVITDKQLDHMADHHPEAYDETLIELKSVLSNPDYIFKDDKHKDTGLVVKAIQTGDIYLYIVLKVFEVVNFVATTRPSGQKRCRSRDACRILFCEV